MRGPRTAVVAWAAAVALGVLSLGGCGDADRAASRSARPSNPARTLDATSELEAIRAQHDAIPSPLEQAQHVPAARGPAPPRVSRRGLTVSGGLELGSPTGEGNVTDLDWRLDEIAVRARGVGLRDVTVTWTSGASFVAPEPSRSERPLGLVLIDTYDDPGAVHREVRHVVPGSSSLDAVLELLPTTAGGPLRLRGTRLASSIRGQITTGSRPSIRLSGFPVGTVGVTVQTYGKVGPLILASQGICRGNPPRERFVAVGHAVDGSVLRDEGGKAASDCPPSRFQMASDADAP